MTHNGTNETNEGVQRPNVRRENQKEKADAQLKSAAASLLMNVATMAEAYNITVAAHAKMLAAGCELRTVNAALTTETLAAAEVAKRALIALLIEAKSVEDIEMLQAKLAAINEVGAVPVKVVEVERGPRYFTFQEA
jgi:hypothetical protein